ncbi:NAD(P)H-dependent glycerol-3-phosphate dehydrogenase [Vallitalea guaymasensis]|uniref:Glycerol-3-phosphate dehydrogenase [NAD(P)+] n=1 Tax=Vallitalea guaymasensis TaxID=1185412 RepID=A0A8J8M764_9FIRM|nr:NAD(P)H-dependent glycerol-3-phosphate dehydrogenase [Vallitalea guaymasensis]QUH27390.1 NAD(P)H-dependent glycerol-3-phosphate dehydrogenase [Vallitalea guaymasensis]
MAAVSVLGAGSWGTALAILLNNNGHEVALWSIIEDEVNLLNDTRENKSKLPGIHIPDEINITNNLKEAILGKDMLVMAVPSKFVRNTANLMKEYVTKDQIIVNVAKGLEDDSLYTLADVINDEMPDNPVAVLSGPSHAEEVSRNIPTTCVAGSKDHDIAKKVQDIFMNSDFRVYTSSDVIGIEMGGALKNVIALAAGISDGIGFGDNTKAAIMTRGITEISRLGVAMGAETQTFAGLSGIGDLIVTCTSMHSRNRRAGILIGKGYSLQEALDEVKMVVEGVYTAKAALDLSEKYKVEMPIIREVNEVLFKGKDTKKAVEDLMIRDKKIEYKK